MGTYGQLIQGGVIEHSFNVTLSSYNLDCKNPHTVADDHGDPEELLEKLDAAEQQTARLREQLKAILAEALLR